MMWGEFFLSQIFLTNLMILVTATVASIAITCMYKKHDLPKEVQINYFIAVFIAVCVFRLIFVFLENSFKDNELVQHMIIPCLINATQVVVLGSNILFFAEMEKYFKLNNVID